MKVTMTIEVGKKDITFTLDEWKKLKGILEEMFPTPEVFPSPYPIYPIPTYPGVNYGNTGRTVFASNVC